MYSRINLLKIDPTPLNVKENFNILEKLKYRYLSRADLLS